VIINFAKIELNKTTNIIVLVQVIEDTKEAFAVISEGFLIFGAICLTIKCKLIIYFSMLFNILHSKN